MSLQDPTFLSAILGLLGVVIGLFLGHFFSERQRRNQFKLLKLEETIKSLQRFKRLQQKRYDKALDWAHLGEGSYKELVSDREVLVELADDLRLLTMAHFKKVDSAREEMIDVLKEIENYLVSDRLDDAINSGEFRQSFYKFIPLANAFERRLLDLAQGYS